MPSRRRSEIPAVELAYWVPNQDAYVDADGRPMQVDPAPKGKIATAIEHEGRRVAAIVHDAELAEERDLVQAVGAAAALTLENERLDAELRAHVDELRASRARIVTAGYAERRRLERDLHDGAQQRLMALGINLRLARDRIGSDTQEAAALLDASLEELNEATRRAARAGARDSPGGADRPRSRGGARRARRALAGAGRARRDTRRAATCPCRISRLLRRRRGAHQRGALRPSAQRPG